MSDEDKLAQEYLDHGFVRVRDPELVKKYITRGCCSQETYEALVRITAETGALIIPFRQLPEVQKLLKQPDTLEGTRGGKP
jgi:hypothetical protein